METIQQQIDRVISQRIPLIAEKVVGIQYQLQPEIWEPYGERGRKLSVRDVGYHIPYLTTAILNEDVSIFTDYMIWLKRLFDGLGFSYEAKTVTFEVLRDVLNQEVTDDLKTLISNYINEGILLLGSPIMEIKSYVNDSLPLGPVLSQYIQFLLNGEKNQASKLILGQVEKGVSIREIYIEIFQKSQYEIGRLWLSNQISVAKEHFCTSATQMIMSQLYPYIFNTQRIGHRFAAACVGGELHEIGVRMVADFFEMEGWDTYYIGANSPASAIIKAIDDYKIELLGLSAAMPFHLPLIEQTISQIRQSEKGKEITIFVGGNAFRGNPDLWKRYGADGYAPDAPKAILLARNIFSYSL